MYVDALEAARPPLNDVTSSEPLQGAFSAEPALPRTDPNPTTDFRSTPTDLSTRAVV